MLDSILIIYLIEVWNKFYKKEIVVIKFFERQVTAWLFYFKLDFKPYLNWRVKYI